MATSQRTAASKPARALAAIAAIALLSGLAPAGPEPPSGAAIGPESDGIAPRFTVHARAALSTRFDSPDGRFAVIPAAVPDAACDSGSDGLFSDGFE